MMKYNTSVTERDFDKNDPLYSGNIRPSEVEEGKTRDPIYLGGRKMLEEKGLSENAVVVFLNLWNEANYPYIFEVVSKDDKWALQSKRNPNYWGSDPAFKK